MNMQFDRQKLKEVIMYVCEQCPRSDLGAVKLHKVLYFSDMMHYADRGVPLTGATYSKRPFGPTCDGLLPALREMQAEGDIKIIEESYFGYKKKAYLPQRTSDKSRFTKEQIELIDEIIDFVCKDQTAKAISEFSHKLPWQLVEMGDEITYESVFLLFSEEVPIETMEWATGEIGRVEAQKSQDDSVGRNNVIDFRSRVLQACGG